MSKQSSIDWLISQLQKSKDFHRVLNEISQMSTAKIDIIEQAKSMHKEEIINAWRQGDGLYDKVSKEMSVQYYKQKFNNEMD